VDQAKWIGFGGAGTVGCINGNNSASSESGVVSFTHDTRFNMARQGGEGEGQGKRPTFAEFNAEIVRDDGVCGRDRRRSSM